MNQLTKKILKTKIKKGELYLTVGPVQRRVYIMADNGATLGTYPMMGVVFNGLDGVDIYVYYTADGRTQDTTTLRQFALKEKDTYCATL